MTTENSEPVRSRSAKRSGIGIVSKVLLILVLYALSPPPVIRAIDWVDYAYQRVTSNEPLLTLGQSLSILGTVYFPLFWLMEECQSVGDFYKWYLELRLWDHLDPPTA